jgi:hypothetical protein
VELLEVIREREWRRALPHTHSHTHTQTPKNKGQIEKNTTFFLQLEESGGETEEGGEEDRKQGRRIVLVCVCLCVCVSNMVLEKGKYQNVKRSDL